MGGADKVERQHHFGKLTVRERIDALVDPGSFHEVGAIAGKQVLQADGTRRFQPANFVMGRADARRPPDRRRRRRLHGARRGVRRVDRRQAGHGRAAGQRVPRPDRPARRRHRRRRLDQVARGVRLHVHPGQPGLGVGRRQPGDGARRVAGPRLGRRARRGAGRHQPLLADGARHLAGVRRRAAARGPPRRDGDQGGARRRPHPRPQRHGQRRRRRPSTRRSSGPASSSRTCRRRSTSWPSAPSPTTTPSAARTG